MGCIDLEHTKLGTEVMVQCIKNVRATVERFPYLTEGRNSDVAFADPRPR